MKVKTFVSGGHDLEAAMVGLEEKINEWFGKTVPQPEFRDLKYAIVEHNDRPYATAMVTYRN